MTGRDRRRGLAVVGQDLIASQGGPGTRRGMALLRSLAAAAEVAITFDDLDDVPDWLRLPRAAQRRVAQRAALLSMAPALARSIDGKMLRAHAETAGEEALDWAMDRIGLLDVESLPAVGAAGLEPRGRALMRATLSERLRPMVEGDAEPIDPSPSLARTCVTEAMKGASNP